MEASHKTHRPHIKVGKDAEEEEEERCIIASKGLQSQIFLLLFTTSELYVTFCVVVSHLCYEIYCS